MSKVIRIGGGGGYAAIHLDPALELIEKGNIDYICFDALSENELSLVTMNKLKNPSAPGYDMQMEKRMKQLLVPAMKNNVKIVSNMGSANPIGAAMWIANFAREQGLSGVKVAAITGDNVRADLLAGDFRAAENNKLISEFGDDLIAAHAYISCESIVEALAKGANIVVTGRMGDAAMFLGPLCYEFGWKKDDWDNLAKGTMIGHLLECAALLTGGNFCDPPYRVVENMAHIGFPIAEIHENGNVFLTKVEGSGGCVTVDTCKDQWLYEITDPYNYKHADVTVDITQAGFEQVGKDRVKITGRIIGKPSPDMLKASMGVRDGYLCQSTVWYGGPNALRRAQLAKEVYEERFRFRGFKPDVYKLFLLGIEGLYGNAPGVPKAEDLNLWEVGLRLAARGQDLNELEEMVHELTGRLCEIGPYGETCESFAFQHRTVVKYYHTFIPRDLIKAQITYVEV